MSVLKKNTLKVLGYEFKEGKELLESLKQNKRRRYPLPTETRVDIVTNQGILYAVTKPYFEFDGRSGPEIVDWYVPNLGTLEEKICWLVHDCNGYGQDLSFEDTNILLFAMLRDLAHYRASKAALIQLAVSLSKSWYGMPKKDDWCYSNIDKVITVFEPIDFEASYEC